MLYRFVDEQKAGGFPVKRVCEIAGVSASAYYDWKAHRDGIPTINESEETRLVKEIRVIHDESDGTYGSPRVTVELHKRGWVLNHKRTERLMRIHGIVGHTPKKRRVTTIPDGGHRIPDRVGRDFTPTELDVTWCGDISYIPTWEGFLYLSFVEDLASRRILGLSMANHMRAELVCDTLIEAIGTRGGDVTGVVFHSDRGTQGGFNWSLQHLECEELGWQGRNVVGLIGRCVHRCGRRVARRGGVVSTRCDSGKVSRAGYRARKPAWRQVYLLLLGRAGSGRVEECNRSRLFHCRAITCRSPNAKRSPS
jgi:hypothetical protein